jgi:hypothetical protein
MRWGQQRSATEVCSVWGVRTRIASGFFFLIFLIQQPYGDGYWGVLFEGARREEVFHCGEQGIFMLSYVSICVSACYATIYSSWYTFTAGSGAYSCSLLWVFVCPHATMYSLWYTSTAAHYYITTIVTNMCVLAPLYICVRILLCMCPHALLLEESSHYYITTIFTTICLSSYYYMCPHTTITVSSYYYICVLIRRCMRADRRGSWI